MLSGQPSHVRAVNDPDWIPSLKLGYDDSSMISPFSKVKRYARTHERAAKSKRNLPFNNSPLVCVLQS